MNRLYEAAGSFRIVGRDSHRGAGHAPDRRRIDLSKPTTSHANQYCRNGGDHRFMDCIHWTRALAWLTNVRTGSTLENVRPTRRPTQVFLSNNRKINLTEKHLQRSTLIEFESITILNATGRSEFLALHARFLASPPIPTMHQKGIYHDQTTCFRSNAFFECLRFGR